MLLSAWANLALTAGTGLASECTYHDVMAVGRVIAGVVAVCLLGSGCGSADGPGKTMGTPPGRTGTVPGATAISPVPTRASDCGTASDSGNPDGGMVAGLDWPAGDRALHTAAQAYICIGGFTGSVVTVTQTGSKLSVQPARFTVPDGGGVLPLTITASTAGRTTLWLRMTNPAGKPQLARPVGVVVADSDQWHFDKPD